jgi:uncharacterized protein
MQAGDGAALAQLASQTSAVLWASFALAVVFGAIAQRSHFCTMGAVADIFNMGDWSRMRQWLIAMATAALGFNTMVAMRWLQAADTIYAAPQLLWLSHAVGGLLFGVGMVLASGCGSKTLVRLGSGSLKALVVFAVLALVAYASLRGVLAVARAATVDRVSLQLPAGQDLPSLVAYGFSHDFSLGGWASSPRSAAHFLSVGLALAVVVGVLARPAGRRWELWWGGIGIGAVVAAVWWVSGALGFVAEHPATLERAFLATNSRRLESLSFVAPSAYTVDWLILFSDSSRTLTIGIVSTLGVVLGSALMALATGSFRWEGFRGVEDTANHIVGAALMGVGGVTALGCTVGQGLSGISTLSLGSFISLAGILGGAWLGLRWQEWRVNQGA